MKSGMSSDQIFGSILREFGDNLYEFVICEKYSLSDAV